MRYVLGLLVLILVLLGGAWLFAGRMGGPAIEFKQPEKFVGASTPVEIFVGAPAPQLKTLTIAVEQNGKTI